MRIYFENYPYPSSEVKPYLGAMRILQDDEDITSDKQQIGRIGYLFVSNSDYKEPIFILPKSFLIKDDDGRHTVLGIPDVHPEDVIDTDNENNPLEVLGKETLLPELGLWLYRALNRFRNENQGTPIGLEAELDAMLPEEDSRDKDFLSTVLELIDFLKEHRNLFTQISLINHSGRNKIDWHKTVAEDPFYENGEPWYLDPAIKEKAVNIDDRLIVLFYSVLKYLRDKYKFPIALGEVPYQLLPVTEIQQMLETGTGSKEMKRIRHKYFRDDLKHLWRLLDSFFTHNTSDDNRNERKEYLLIKKVDVFFEKMIDAIISDPTGVEALKNQQDGKLIDHIFRYTSLVGKFSDIYYIGDSKYYMDGNNPEGVALYKQFTYARNAIQFHIERLYLENRKPTVPILKGDIRYRDTLTEGYNITPNFFIRSRVTKDDATYDSPALIMTDWDKAKGQKYPKTNKHFEDRLFDRDTLLLREFSINFLFVIAAYAGYEDSYWASEIRTTIRNSFIRSIDDEYSFYILTPDKATGTVKFNFLYSEWTRGKIYTIDETGDYFILAFEKSRKGQEDLEAFKSAKLRSVETGEEVTYTLSSTTLEALDS